MPTSITLPSSGQLSMKDIKDVLYGARASNTRSLKDMSLLCNFSAPHKISDFYLYKMECSTLIRSMSFDISGLPTKTPSIIIVGGSATFSSSTNVNWINVTDDNTNDKITVSCDNNTGSSRSGTITIKHNNNPDVYDTISVTQEGVSLYSISASPSSFNLPFTKNTVSSTITTLPSAGAWYIQSSPSWVNASKSGDATLTMAMGINDSPTARSGNVVLVHSISSRVATNVLITQQGTG